MCPFCFVRHYKCFVLITQNNQVLICYGAGSLATAAMGSANNTRTRARSASCARGIESAYVISRPREPIATLAGW